VKYHFSLVVAVCGLWCFGVAQVFCRYCQVNLVEIIMRSRFLRMSTYSVAVYFATALNEPVYWMQCTKNNQLVSDYLLTGFLRTRKLFFCLYLFPVAGSHLLFSLFQAFRIVFNNIVNLLSVNLNILVSKPVGRVGSRNLRKGGGPSPSLPFHFPLSVPLEVDPLKPASVSGEHR